MLRAGFQDGWTGRSLKAWLPAHTIEQARAGRLIGSRITWSPIIRSEYPKPAYEKAEGPLGPPIQQVNAGGRLTALQGGFNRSMQHTNHC
jgi:hypothetical protein